MQSIETWCGVDVSAKTLTSRRRRKGVEQERTFVNTVEGHDEAVRWLGKGARVCVEATGVYHLQFCLALVRGGVEVMVVNPRAAKDFGRAMQNRSKTDAVDAGVLLEYARRMEFMPWQPPSAAVLEVRELGRRIKELTQAGVDEKNRLHARNVAGTSKTVVADLRQHVAHIARRIAAIEKRAAEVIAQDDDLREQFSMLVRGKGIGPRSAILLLTELAVLDPTMTVRQVVAYSGLDPRVYDSGTSVHKPARISKIGNARVRAALYMIALSAIRHDEGARSFYLGLLRRGKKPKQAIVAVMRKLLHGIWIVMQRRVAFDSSLLFAQSLAKAESTDSATDASQPELQQDHPKGRSEAKELRQQLDPAPAEATCLNAITT